MATCYDCGQNECRCPIDDGEPRTEILTWDHRAQPDLEHLADLVTTMSGGRVQMAEADTQSDQYAWVISNRPITTEQATEAYDRWYESEDGHG